MINDTKLCPKCHTTHNRDVNVAINIRTVGITGIAFGKTNTS
ncbi:MAG: transposase [Methanobrevibacter sp.]|nr:transposase [Candidatus Methanovirga basalitermitum]